MHYTSSAFFFLSVVALSAPVSTWFPKIYASASALIDSFFLFLLFFACRKSSDARDGEAALLPRKKEIARRYDRRYYYMGSGLDGGPYYADSGDVQPVSEIAIEGRRAIEGAEFDSPPVGGEGPQSPTSALPANRWTPCDLEAIGCQHPRARTAAVISEGSAKRPSPLGAGLGEGRCSPTSSAGGYDARRCGR